MSTETAQYPAAAGKLTGQATRVTPDGDIHTVDFELPHTDYRLALVVPEPIAEDLIDARVKGVIHAHALRVDVIQAGGRFIEPVFGRPRRLQGRVKSVDVSNNRIVVNCAVPIVCELTAPGQTADQFEVTQLVSFDVKAGTSLDLI